MRPAGELLEPQDRGAGNDILSSLALATDIELAGTHRLEDLGPLQSRHLSCLSLSFQLGFKP